MMRIHILCEGPSERAYIQQINRLLHEHDIPVIFLATVTQGGNYPHVIREYSKLIHRKPTPKNVWIWLDYDLYLRDDKFCWETYCNRSKTIPSFYFSIQNFEDYLSLHLPRKKRDQWIAIMRKYNHWRWPTHGKVYTPLFRKHVGRYDKGTIRTGFITERSLTNLKLAVDERLEILFPPRLKDFENFAQQLIILLDSHHFFA